MRLQRTLSPRRLVISEVSHPEILKRGAIGLQRTSRSPTAVWMQCLLCASKRPETARKISEAKGSRHRSRVCLQRKACLPNVQSKLTGPGKSKQQREWQSVSFAILGTSSWSVDILLVGVTEKPVAVTETHVVVAHFSPLTWLRPTLSLNTLLSRRGQNERTSRAYSTPTKAV